MATASLYVRVDVQIKADLDRLADEVGLPLTQVVEEVLARGLGKERTTRRAELRKRLDG